MLRDGFQARCLCCLLPRHEDLIENRDLGFACVHELLVDANDHVRPFATGVFRGIGFYLPVGFEGFVYNVQLDLWQLGVKALNCRGALTASTASGSPRS